MMLLSADVSHGGFCHTYFGCPGTLENDSQPEERVWTGTEGRVTCKDPIKGRHDGPRLVTSLEG